MNTTNPPVLHITFTSQSCMTMIFKSQKSNVNHEHGSLNEMAGGYVYFI